MGRTAKKNPVQLSPPKTRSAAGPEEQVVDRAVKKIATQFDKRFERIEKAVEAIAAATTGAEKTARNNKRKVQEDQVSPQPVQKARKRAVVQESPTRPVRINSLDEDLTLGPARPWADVQQARGAHDHLARRGQQPELNSVNKNNDWSTWLLAETDFASRAPGSSFLPTSAKDVVYNEDLEAQATQIYENTPSQLAKGMSKGGYFPFKYVTRGPEKRKATVNSLSLAEHIWGILCMIKDPTVQSEIKPLLLNHIDEIVDDCRQYEWASAVRPWSEEVFALVAEGRLSRGWASKEEIRFLRITMSRVSTAKLHSREAPPKGRALPAAGAPEQMKGGPPCPEFNSIKDAHSLRVTQAMASG